MGGFYSKHDNILSRLENDSSVVVIKAGIIKIRVFSKQSLTSPYKVRVVWRKKENNIEQLEISSTIEHILSNFRIILNTCVECIETSLGKVIQTNEVIEMLKKELSSHSHFESNGVYTLNFSFTPYILISNNSYKILYHSQMKKTHVPEIQNISNTNPETSSFQSPTADIYGKI
jgi:hypothetical protein